MAIKKKNKKKDIFQIEIFKKAVRKNSNTDYASLFESLSPKQFLAFIFRSPHLARRKAMHWKVEYKKMIMDFIKIYNYFNEDDLYKFFQINHELNRDKNQYEYLKSLFHCTQDLIEQVPYEEFLPLMEPVSKDPIYIYGFDKATPILSNFARDYIYYNRDTQELRKMYSLDATPLYEMIEEIYQEGLLPIDISQRSYY